MDNDFNQLPKTRATVRGLGQKACKHLTGKLSAATFGTIKPLGASYASQMSKLFNYATASGW